jgi:hypothetical protein
MSSWHEHIQSIKRDKVKLPYEINKYHGRKRVTHRDVKARDRVFDPVVQKYTETERERKALVEERARLERSQNLAIQRAALRSQSCKAPYNVLTHELKPLCKNLPVKKFEKVPDTRTSYNILNLEKKPKDRFIHDPTKRRRRSSRANVQRKKVSDYNILSNKFRVNDEEKRAEETRRSNEKSMKKYWETHHYDPIRVSYFDNKKEQKYRSMRSELEKTHGKSSVEFLPKSTKHSEGNLYNIVNHEIKHEERYRERVNRDTRRIQSKERASRFEQMQKKKSEAQAELLNQQSFNRISPKRETQQRHRGFDFITNQSYEGFNRKNLHPPRKTEAPPLWMSLKGGSSRTCVPRLKLG